MTGCFWKLTVDTYGYERVWYFLTEEGATEFAGRLDQDSDFRITREVFEDRESFDASSEADKIMKSRECDELLDSVDYGGDLEIQSIIDGLGVDLKKRYTQEQWNQIEEILFSLISKELNESGREL
jgi:hypothetical protein